MIPSISNELEFNLDGVEAERLLGNALPLHGEVNPRDIVELNVSLARTTDELNERLDELVGQLQKEAEMHGGSIYGGGTLLGTTAGVEPARYPTTRLSDTLAHGLLDITSQQVVIGLERDDWRLYTYLSDLSPMLVATAAASPLHGDPLRRNGTQSRRVAAYAGATRMLPPTMVEQPRLASRDEYEECMATTSHAVKGLLERGALDTVGMVPEAFEGLEPHQVYWMVRPRPDHANSECALSLEVRAPDLPVTRRRMQFLNGLVMGLAYRAVDEPEALPSLPPVTTHAMHRAAYGLDARLNGCSTRELLPNLIGAARDGLAYRGQDVSALDEGARILAHGTDAERFGHYTDAARLRGRLGREL